TRWELAHHAFPQVLKRNRKEGRVSGIIGVELHWVARSRLARNTGRVLTEDVLDECRSRPVSPIQRQQPVSYRQRPSAIGKLRTGYFFHSTPFCQGKRHATCPRDRKTSGKQGRSHQNSGTWAANP